MDGQAPGAKVVSSRACSWGGGCTAVALTDGMVDLVENRGVDVVNMSIGGLPALNDANNARARLYDALIDGGVQLVISAGNSGPGINTIGDPSVATNVVSVGSSITKETWLANYGSEVSTPLTLHNYSSRGPREDGGFKPNVMAPGSAISTIPTWQAGRPGRRGRLRPAPGLRHVQRHLDGLPADRGWRRAAAVGGEGHATSTSPRARSVTPSTPPPTSSRVSRRSRRVPARSTSRPRGRCSRTVPPSQDYTVSAPVCTPISDFLATPDTGTGVYNRCDARPRRPGRRARTRSTWSGRPAPPAMAGRVATNLRLVGNDGTFSLPTASRSDARRASRVEIPVKARTSTPGVHSAILEIDDPATAGRRPPRPAHGGPVHRPRRAVVRDQPVGHGGAQPHQEALRDRARKVPRRSRSTSPASPARTRSAGSPSTPMASRWSRPPRWSASPTSAPPAATAPRVPTRTRCRASGRSRWRRVARRRAW